MELPLNLKDKSCPCGKAITYAECCGQYLDGNILPGDPESLMRSRYTAFVLSNINYLSQTMHGKALKKFNVSGLDTWLKQVKWLGLTVIKSQLISPSHGFVTFEANYLENEISHAIKEKSEFLKINGKWFYIDGRHY